VKLTKGEARGILEGVVAIINGFEGKYELLHALNRNRTKLKILAEEIAEMYEVNKKFRQTQQLKYCAKDKDGKPIVHNHPIMQGEKEIGRNTFYEGLERGLNPEYDDEMDKVAEAEKARMKEPFEFEPYMIKPECLPKEIKEGLGVAYVAIMPLIEEK